MAAGQINPQSAQIAGLSLPVASAVQTASVRSGVDFAYLVKKAAVESGFDPAAKSASSTATGLYQFTQATWLDMVASHGHKHGLGGQAAEIAAGGLSTARKREILALREDPRLSALMAAEYTGDNRAHLERRVGGEVGDTELYLAHFLGPNGAEKFLKALRADPEQAAAPLLPAAAKANRSVFYQGDRARSLQEIYDRFSAKFDGASALPKDLAAAIGLGAAGSGAANPDAARPGAVSVPFGRSGWLSAPMHVKTGATGLAGSLGTARWLSAPLPGAPLAASTQFFLSQLGIPGESSSHGEP